MNHAAHVGAVPRTIVAAYASATSASEATAEPNAIDFTSGVVAASLDVSFLRSGATVDGHGCGGCLRPGSTVMRFQFAIAKRARVNA